LPFLRFTRDKRGYETTALVHADRGRQGRARQRVLYWFRSPPNVKVGRPALDQEAIRWIEEHNPDIEFDWPQILQSTPPPAPPAEDARGRRPRRGRTDRPARNERSERPERRGAQRAPAQPPAPVEQGAAPLVSPPAAAPDPEPLPSPFSAPFAEAALEQITHPDAEEAPPVAQSAVENVLGREQLIRFRARYAELQARIIERGGEPARVEELRAQAEPLNPDSWVTADEARKGVQDFEPKIRELRASLGLKRRRRSRRGGRRRRSGQPASGSPGAQTVAAAPSSNAPSEGREREEEEEEDEGGEA
jgi:ribonuclease E